MSIRNYRMAGRFECDGTNTAFVFGPGQLGKLFGTGPVPLNAKDSAGGYNQLVFSVFGIGAKTWSLDVNLTESASANWVRLASGLANQTSIVSIGPLHPGIFTPGASVSLPAFLPESVRIVLSAADAAGRIDIVATGFNP